MRTIKLSMKQEHFEWMEKCLNCWRFCEQFISTALESNQYLEQVNLCRDVTEICSQTLSFQVQNSPFFGKLCSITAVMCEALAARLEKIENRNHAIEETLSSCRIFADYSKKISKFYMDFE